MAVATTSNPRTTVTEQQLEYLALYASGCDTSEIGEIKFVHSNTVRYQLRQALERVGAKNYAHLTALVISSGLLRRDGVGFFPITEQRIIG